ncbi:MAG: thiamine pyrophosphate-binding protein [Pseudomonadota bacterium]
MYVFQSIAKALAENDVKTVFGLMGDANLFMVNHFVREEGGAFIPFVHEAGTVLAACCYAHVTGGVGVATVTHGPAFTNCITALVEGVRNNAQIVLLAGDTAAEAKHNLQNIDQRELAKSTGAGFEQVRSAATAAEDIAVAFQRCKAEKRPIVVNMPVDFMWQETDHQDRSRKTFSAPSMVPEGDDFDDAIGMIASARRPLILAGLGAAGARAALIRLSERLEAPLATTLLGKEMFLGHPANIGVFGTLSTPGAYDIIGSCDCVIVFGSSLSQFTTDQGKLLIGKRVVQIDTDTRAVGGIYQPDVALIADAGLTAQNIVHWLNEAEITPSGFSREIDPTSVLKHPAGEQHKTTEGFVNFEFALDRMDRGLPARRTVVCDGGRFVTEVWCRIAATDPRHFVKSTRFASIGLGLPMAIGAACADPDRPTLCFTGDGGFMAGGLTEFNTAVRGKLDLIVVVCNDAAYGAEHIQFKDRQLDPSLSQFDWPSFAETANALGGVGLEVANDDDLERALDAVAKRDPTKPMLIDLKLDPDNVPRMRH